MAFNYITTSTIDLTPLSNDEVVQLREKYKEKLKARAIEFIKKARKQNPNLNEIDDTALAEAICKFLYESRKERHYTFQKDIYDKKTDETRRVTIHRRRPKRNFDRISDVLAKYPPARAQRVIAKAARRLERRRLKPFSALQASWLAVMSGPRKKSVHENKIFAQNQTDDRLYYRIHITEKSTTEVAVTEFLERYHYKVSDYKEGYAHIMESHPNYKKGQEKNPIKLGRILDDLAERKQRPVESYHDMVRRSDSAFRLLKEFENDEFRQKNLLLCISRNRTDIETMSTDRGWRSCMSPDHARSMLSVPAHVGNGGLISYLIREDDLDVTDPLARRLIQPLKKVSNDYRRPLALRLIEGEKKFLLGGLLLFPNLALVKMREEISRIFAPTAHLKILQATGACYGVMQATLNAASEKWNDIALEKHPYIAAGVPESIADEFEARGAFTAYLEHDMGDGTYYISIPDHLVKPDPPKRPNPFSRFFKS